MTPPPASLINCVINSIKLNNGDGVLCKITSDLFKLFIRAQVQAAKQNGCTFNHPQKNDIFDELTEVVTSYIDPTRKHFPHYEQALPVCKVKTNPNQIFEEDLRRHVVKEMIDDRWAVIENMVMTS